MEAIEKSHHIFFEVLYILTDRFPGLFALLFTLAIIAGLIR